MSLAYESGADLAIDTDVIKIAGEEYKKIGQEMRYMAKTLDSLLQELKSEAWTTGAGEAFQSMVSTKWSENINKYANMLDTMNDMLAKAAGDYEKLLEDHIRNTKLNYR